MAETPATHTESGEPSDPIKNCVTEACCLPLANGAASDDACHALAKVIAYELAGDNCTPMRAAEAVLQHFELAERGTLQPFKQSLARLLKAGSPKHE